MAHRTRVLLIVGATVALFVVFLLVAQQVARRAASAHATSGSIRYSGGHGSRAAPAPATSGSQAAPGGKPSSGAATRLPSLVEFGSNTCVPCQQMAPILKELAAQYKGKIEVTTVDVYKEPRLAERQGIRAIPTQVFFDKQGKEVSRHVGFFPKEEIVAAFKELGFLR